MSDWVLVNQDSHQTIAAKFRRWQERSARVFLATYITVFCGLSQRTNADEPPRASLTESEIQNAVKAGLDAVQIERWDTAIAKFQAVAEANPSHELAVFYLGYSLHGAKRFDEAIKAHAQASKFPRFKQTALYNWSCALALQGRKPEALAKLKEAIERGFVHRIDIAADPDMKPLIGNPDFDDLRQRAMPYSQRQAFQQFDFFLGDWEEFDDQDTQIGSGRVTRPVKGKMLIGNWTHRDGRTATGMTLYDSAKQHWIRTWSTSAGVVINYEGNRTDGNAVRLIGRVFMSDGRSTFQRLILRPSGDGSVRKTVEESTDGGIEWSNVSTSPYRRPNRQASVQQQ